VKGNRKRNQRARWGGGPVQKTKAAGKEEKEHVHCQKKDQKKQNAVLLARNDRDKGIRQEAPIMPRETKGGGPQRGTVEKIVGWESA